MSKEHKDPVRVAGGLKASINNPNVGEEAKQNAQDRLNQLDQGKPVEQVQSEDSPGLGSGGSVIGGHKANIKNPKTGHEAKEQSKQFLEEQGALAEEYK